MRFRDGSDKGTAIVRIVFANVGKSAAETRTMIRQAFREGSRSRGRKMENCKKIKNGETGEEQSQ
jgi:hypothetical protein